jgi:hypothetical protein
MKFIGLCNIISTLKGAMRCVCVLHNYLRNNQILEGNVDDDMEEMPKNQLLPYTHTNSMSASAFVVRQKFKDYFSTVGSVLWQADSVSRGKY